MQFQVGDVVQLKSGGPRMTVERIDQEIVYCSWFPQGDIRRTEAFNVETLRTAGSAVGVRVRTESSWARARRQGPGRP
jgi:uncharacterized protein YodC (DUF2158 family)